MKTLYRFAVYKINCNWLRFILRLKQPLIQVLYEELVDEPESNKIGD
jgi:hypothetical protein